MLMKHVILLGLMLVFSVQLMAIKPVEAAEVSAEYAEAVENIQVNNTTAAYDGGIIGKFLKKNKTVKKMTNWVQNKVLKKDFSINDPVNKWLWYAIILAVLTIVISIVFSFIPGLWRISWIITSLLGLAVTVCFIYWLLLFLEVI